MERVNAAFAFRRKLLDALGNPLRSVARYNLDVCKLLLGKLAVESLQDGFSVPLSCPRHGVRVVVDNNRDVLVPFLVAGFVNANAHKAVKPSCAIRFDVV